MQTRCDLGPPQCLALGLEPLVRDGVGQADGIPKAETVDVQRVGIRFVHPEPAFQIIILEDCLCGRAQLRAILDIPSGTEETLSSRCREPFLMVTILSLTSGPVSSAKNVADFGESRTIHFESDEWINIQ